MAIDQKLALAMLTKKVIRISKDAALWETEGSTRTTTESYLLDPDGKVGLRGQCKERSLWPVDQPYLQSEFWAHKFCTYCQGRGWVPTDDPWVYVRAGWPVLNNPRKPAFEGAIVQAISKALDERVDPGQAAFDVVAEMLLKGEVDGPLAQHKEQKLPDQKRLYRTEKEEQEYRILKERYGITDATRRKGGTSA